jgi:tetratricopeptide (TPR) repeat protein
MLPLRGRRDEFTPGARPRALANTLQRLAFTELLVLLVACALHGQQLPGQGREASIVGRVRTDQGVVVKSAMVQLETPDGERVAEQPVNTAGEFYFSFIPKQQYVLVVTADGFEPYRELVDLGESGGQVNKNITLSPANKIAQEKATPPALSDAQAPKEAKREYEKAEKAVQSHKLGEARKHLQAAVEQYPCYARAQTDLGLLFSQQKEYKDSEAAFRTSIKCDPGYLDAYSSLGALLNAERRYNEAAAVLEEGVRQAPGSWQFYFQMGVAEYGMKHYDVAEQQYLKARSLTSAPAPELDAKLADVYLRKNDFPKAYAEMQDYLKAEPDGPLAPRIKDIMKQMESAGVLAVKQNTTGGGSH